MEVWFCASLRIFGIGLDFDMITQALGFQPSESHRAGDNAKPLSKPYSEDMWRVDSPLARTDSIDAHLHWLRQVLSPHYDFLRELAGKFTLSSYCGVSVVDSHCTFRISAEALKIFLELGIPLNLSIVMIGTPEPPISTPAEGVGEQPEAGPGGFREVSSASLLITGSGVDIRHISAILTFIPSETRYPSNVADAGRGPEADSWAFASGLPRSEGLDAHLRWLGAIILPHVDFLRSLCGRARLFFSCDLATENDHGGAEISPEALRIPVQLDAPIEFNVRLT
jgi:hypothetical protein